MISQNLGGNTTTACTNNTSATCGRCGSKPSPPLPLRDIIIACRGSSIAEAVHTGENSTPLYPPLLLMLFLLLPVRVHGVAGAVLRAPAGTASTEK